MNFFGFNFRDFILGSQNPTEITLIERPEPREILRRRSPTDILYVHYAADPIIKAWVAHDSRYQHFIKVGQYPLTGPVNCPITDSAILDKRIMYLPEPNDVELLLGRLCRFLFTGQYRDDVDFANAMMTYNRRPEWLPPLKKRFTYYPNGDLYLCHGADELIWNTTNGLDYAAMARRRAENIAMLIEDMNRRERNITYSIPSLTPITGDVAGCQSFMDFMGQTLRDYDEFVRGRLHTEDGWLIDLSYEAFQRAMHETDSRVQMQRHWDATGGENGRTEEQDPAFDEFIQSIETFLDDDDTEEYDDDTPIKAAPSA